MDVVAGGLFEGECEAALVVESGEEAGGVVGVEFGELEVEEGDFDRVDAHELPHVEGEQSDEVLFGFVDGVIAGEVGVDAGVVGGAVLGVDNDVLGAEAVGDVVGGSSLFRCFWGSVGSAGFGAVKA